jgi:8-oxo-dGTP pyrophosphatase MutT (NUDIX family)
MQRLPRRTAKVLLIDRRGCVLLFSGIDRTRPDEPAVWFAVGGAADEGETLEAAAVREVAEETGLQLSDVGTAVMRRRFDWEFEGTAYDQEETYFVARVETFTPAMTGWTEIERATTEHRWWSVQDLRATTATVYPERLADLLESLE